MPSNPGCTNVASPQAGSHHLAHNASCGWGIEDASKPQRGDIFFIVNDTILLKDHPVHFVFDFAFANC